MHLAWYRGPNLAVTVADGLLVVDVEATKSMNGEDVTCEGSLPLGMTHLRTPGGEAPTSVAASADGTMLAAGTSLGRVTAEPSAAWPHCLSLHMSLAHTARLAYCCSGSAVKDTFE